MQVGGFVVCGRVIPVLSCICLTVTSVRDQQTWQRCVLTVFENTYFMVFFRFPKKHDFLRFFFLNDVSKSRKKSLAKV